MTGEGACRTIGHYELVERIGDGGMGTVYRGRDPRFDRPVAVKMLHSRWLRDPIIAERFRSEAVIQAKLNHPNIVAVYDFIADDEVLAMIMEFVDGKTLDEVLVEERGPLPLARAVNVFSQVLSALNFAHGKGLVHRDIKPSNLMAVDLGDEEIAKVMDFGIAKILGSEKMRTVAGSTLGTLAYMSPEQVRSPDKVGAAADLYSLGATLYEAVVGRPPFDAETEYDLMTQIVQADPGEVSRIVPGLPQEFDALLRRAMAKNPADRFATAAAMRDALLVLAPGSPVQLRRSSAGGRLGPIATGDDEAARVVREINRVAEVVDQHLAAGDFEAARRSLELAETRWAGHPRLVELAQGIRDRESRTRADGVRKLLDKAQAQIDKSDLVAASKTLEKVQATLGEVGEAVRRELEARHGALFDEIVVRQRTERLAKLTRDVEALLTSGKLEDARKRVEEAGGEGCDGEDFDHIVDQVERAETEARRRREEGEGHLARCRELLSEGALERARVELDSAAEALPDSEEVSTIRTKLEQAVAAEAERRRLQTIRTDIEAKVSSAIQSGDVEAAVASLAEGDEALAGDEQWVGLRRELTTLVEETRRQRIDQLVTEALANGVTFETAIRKLETAQCLDPLNERVSTLLEKIREELRRWRERQRQEHAAEELVKRLEGIAASGDLPLLRRVLAVAEKELPDDLLLSARTVVEHAEAEEASRRARRDELVVRARELSTRGNHGEAIEMLEQASQIVPGDVEVEALLEVARAARKREIESQRRLRETSAVISEVEAALSAGDVEKAAHVLGLAERVVGDVEELQPLRVWLEKLRSRQMEENTALLDEAKAAAATGAYEQALALIRKAQAVGADAKDVALAERETQRLQAQDAIARYLDEGKRHEAGRALDLAEKLFGLDDRLTELRRRFES